MSRLANLIERIDWKMITPRSSYGSSRLPPDKMSIQFFKKPEHKDDFTKPMEVRIRLGHEVAERLDLRAKDRVGVFLDPNDEMVMMLAKINSGGFRVAPEATSSALRITFKWQGVTPLKEMPTTQVEFHISQRRLIFEVRRPIEHSFG